MVRPTVTLFVQTLNDEEQKSVEEAQDSSRC